jgi:hypothetical protein
METGLSSCSNWAHWQISFLDARSQSVAHLSLRRVAGHGYSSRYAVPDGRESVAFGSSAGNCGYLADKQKPADAVREKVAIDLLSHPLLVDKR